MRILSLDVGKKKIGIAISDPLGITSQGLETLLRKDKKGDIAYIKEIVSSKGVIKIVVGLPLNMNGTEGEMARDVYAFARELKEHIEIPFEMWDERLSTLEAERLLLEADVSRKKRKKVNDKLAAQIILQSYLDSRGKSV